MSPQIHFNVTGETYRRSGRWISLVAENIPDDNKFQNMLQGEWFVTQVTHLFNQTEYRQDIVANKFYTYHEKEDK